MSACELLDVIDANNRVIGQAEKRVIYANELRHRVVHVFVRHAGRLLVTRRSERVRYLPGFFCSSAAGHVQAGESSHQGALRELREEIGLEGPIRLVDEFFWKHDFPIHISIFVKDLDPASERIALNPDEVGESAFFSLDEIKALDRASVHPQLFPCVEAIERGNYV